VRIFCVTRKMQIYLFMTGDSDSARRHVSQLGKNSQK
jgi:hypothetical protein